MRRLPLLALLLLAACDSAVFGAVPDVDGLYGSTAPGHLRLRLDQSGETVTGTARYALPGGYTYSVTGHHDYPAIDLTLRDGPLAVSHFSGTVHADGSEIRGTFEGDPSDFVFVRE